MASEMHDALPYRLNVGIMLINHEGLVFVGQRRDNHSDAWQMPQGGIDDGESPVDAAWRELEEETGLTADEVELRSKSVGWTFYEFPDGHMRLSRHLGQVHRWFRFMARDSAIEPVLDDVEFVSWSWMTSSELLEVVVDFRKPGYEEMLLNAEAWQDV